MNKTLKGALLLGSLLMLGMQAPAWSQSADEEDTDIDLATLSCRTLLKMDNEDREFTLVFFHGLISGRQEEMIFRAQALAEATDQIVDQCIDNPDEPLLTVFEKARKG